MRRSRLVGVVVVLALAVTAFVLSSIGVISAQAVFPYANPNPVVVNQPTTIYAGYNPSEMGYGQGYGPGMGYGTTTYAWSFTIPGCSDPGSVSSFVCTPTAPGSYVVGITVTDSDGTISNQFTLTVEATVTFTERGLLGHQPWAASYQGVTKTASPGSPILFTGVAGDSDYAYLVRGPSGWLASSPQGTIASPIGPNTVAETFVRGATDNFRIHEVGAAPGSPWCITIVAPFCTTSTVVVIKNLTPGVYDYSIGQLGTSTSIVKFGPAWIAETSGSMTLARHRVATAVTIQLRYAYAVTFTETGLTGSFSWFVVSQGMKVSSSSDTILLYLTNGTAGYRVPHEVGYRATYPSLPPRLVIAGLPLAVAITYTPVR
jgi:hypothetical protein